MYITPVSAPTKLPIYVQETKEPDTVLACSLTFVAYNDYGPTTTVCHG